MVLKKQYLVLWPEVLRHSLPLVQVDRVSLEWMVGKFPPLRYSFLRQGQEAGFGGQYRNCVGMMAVPDAGDVRTGSVHG
eukprot:CAMPEP_0181503680 /NCGR_PEP_ID=MMETSP1110-20121109/57059_1 /TAXON_ID=174948 /ORGANISM="Symbiodinium sp., Strain CCMP421" /LENGTH=78 /DNA_ID=CAMNT_0023632425 /DNA_START=385 /DNA_END=621 /DNA_ORIENTATION=-